VLLLAATAQAQTRKPNILVIWGDDIGQFNISAYNMGVMGYRTPNIDSIARQGALFTDWYGQQNCTAGRAAFITGQSPIRTGLTKVGLPGAPEGMKKEDPTIATLLRAQGYMTGQFGKNHLGDRDDMLPTNHGFDEFFGNLYHLNAEEEPENPDYPKSAEFRKKFGSRGVIHSFADGRITDTGPLTRKRMETIDDEVMAKSLEAGAELTRGGGRRARPDRRLPLPRKDGERPNRRRHHGPRPGQRLSRAAPPSSARAPSSPRRPCSRRRRGSTARSSYCWPSRDCRTRRCRARRP
jgi:arylsulfatase A-like enzyme